jgi:phosphoribosyl 1,2-cyclic phosphodiesterase
MRPTHSADATGDLTLRFWGTRGSLPIPGWQTIRYGGNTCCIEVRLGTRLFFIDAGSGFEAAGHLLCARPPATVDLLLSHLHHDHISGLPFFGPIFTGRTSIRTFCGNLNGQSAKAALDVMFSPPLFPVRLDDLPAGITHVGFRAGQTLRFEDGVLVATCPLHHPGGATAYRFDHGGRRLCYVSDIEHVDDSPEPGLVRFCEGADLVVYDAMFTEDEFPRYRGWGHSTWKAGVALCRAAGARALAAFHHGKRHDDAELDRMDAELAAALPGSFFAAEGQTVTLHRKTLGVPAAEFPVLERQQV